jgi:uncharacterized protein
MILTGEEKDHLKELVRNSIKNRFDKSVVPQLKLDSEILRMNCGAFVTLKIDKNLRGCIGMIVGMKPLYQTIIEMAQAAAFEDPRFAPLSEKEFDKIEIEISVLSPFETIDNTDQIEVGKHGLMIRQGVYSGLLLPQVATEYNWDKETFLKHTCLKAGLPENAYLDKSSEIQIFSAEVF